MPLFAFGIASFGLFSDREVELSGNRGFSDSAASFANVWFSSRCFGWSRIDIYETGMCFFGQKTRHQNPQFSLQRRGCDARFIG